MAKLQRIGVTAVDDYAYPGINESLKLKSDEKAVIREKGLFDEWLSDCQSARDIDRSDLVAELF